MIANQVGNDALGEKFEYRRVTKKTGDIDQQIPGEPIAFGRIAKQEIKIVGGDFDRRQGHPPLDAPLERTVLVKSEIMRGLGAQESNNVRQQLLQRLLRGRFRRLRHKDLTALARDQRFCDLRRAEHEVDCAGRDSATGHAVVIGFADVLRNDEAALALHRLQAKTAVSASSGEDHANGARSIFASKRIQEEVERQPRAMSRLRLRKPQRALVVGREIDAGRNDIDALAFDRHSVGRKQDRHRRMTRQQIHHHAVVARIEVLHDDEGHAVDRRQRAEEFPARVEAAGRSADRDDRKPGRFARRERLGYPARSPPLDGVLEASWHFAIFLDERRPNGRARTK